MQYGWHIEYGGRQDWWERRLKAELSMPGSGVGISSTELQPKIGSILEALGELLKKYSCLGLTPGQLNRNLWGSQALVCFKSFPDNSNE